MEKINQIALGLFLFFSSLLLGMFLSTQWCASLLHYPAFLGEPWIELKGFRLYIPWKFISWDLTFSRSYPRLFSKVVLPTMAGLGLGFFWLWLLTFIHKKNGVLTTHGSARWASKLEIKKAGLFDDDGVVLGLTKEGDEYLRHNGPEHICVFAPTRSGKGVGLVVPTLLTWKESVVCFDPKGENWRITSGFRSKFGQSIYFDPTSLLSAKFNPLFEVRKGECETKDVQNIADILVDPEGVNQRRDHWDRTAHSLLMAAILHVLYAEKDKTLSGVANFLADPKRSFLVTLDVMMKTKHLGEIPHPIVASVGREILNKAENERSGVLSTAMSYLGLYRDPIIAKATSACDFRIADIMNGAHPLSLYLVVPPSDMSRTKPLIRLMLNQIGRMLTEKLEVEGPQKPKYRLLFLLDEFPALGRLDFFESALAYIAGYGIKALLITQSLNQIEKTYGANNSILDNCHIRIAFASNDDKTAKRISDLLGIQTAEKQQKSFSGDRGSPFLEKSSISHQEFSRPLLTPSEVNQLPQNREIIFVAGTPPILATKLLYYEDTNFTARLLPPVMLDGDAYPDKPQPRENLWPLEGEKTRPVSEEKIEVMVPGEDIGEYFTDERVEEKYANREEGIVL